MSETCPYCDHEYDETEAGACKHCGCNMQRYKGFVRINKRHVEPSEFGDELEEYCDNYYNPMHDFILPGMLLKEERVLQLRIFQDRLDSYNKNQGLTNTLVFAITVFFIESIILFVKGQIGFAVIQFIIFIFVYMYFDDITKKERHFSRLQALFKDIFHLRKDNQLDLDESL